MRADQPVCAYLAGGRSAPEPPPRETSPRRSHPRVSHADVVQPARVSLKVTLSTLTSEFLFINLATFADLLGWQA